MTSPWPGRSRDTRSFSRRASVARYYGHVAAAIRVDHREHAVEHGVAGEEDPFLLEQEAEVVRRVAGRVQHLEAELGALDRVAFADDAVGDDVASLSMRLP